MKFKTGCLPSSPRAKELRLFLSDFMPAKPALPPLQGSCDWTPSVKKATPWLMLGNGPDDTVHPNFPGAGDCVVAAGYHHEMVMNFNAGRPYIPTAVQVLADYSAITGFDVNQTPDDPQQENPTDTGTDPDTFMKYWRDTGLGPDRHKIGAWVALNPGRWVEYQYSVQCLDGVLVALALPLGIDYENDKVWDCPPGADLTSDAWMPGGAGGHMVMSSHSDAGFPILDISRPGLYTVTWGMEVFVTIRFLAAYCKSAYAVLSGDMLNGEGKSPAGFDRDGLHAALKAVATA